MQNKFTKIQGLKLDVYNSVPKNVTEKQFIIDFFKELPLDDLKRLINFKEMNPDNDDLWKEPNNHDLLHQLKFKNEVLFSCELWLDNGIDDLSLGQLH